MSEDSDTKAFRRFNARRMLEAIRDGGELDDYWPQADAETEAYVVAVVEKVLVRHGLIDERDVAE